MKKILLFVIIILLSASYSFAARSAVSSGDTPSQAWTKQNSMNLETYRKTTPTESGFTGMDAAVIATGTINDARIPDGIARDDEIVASPITPDATNPNKAAAAVISDSSEFATAAGTADSVPATGITGTLSDTQIPDGVARDEEVSAAIGSALEGFEGGGSTIAPAETDNTKAAIAVEAESVPASGVVQDETHRLVSDTEKTAWSEKQDALGYTPESAGNKATDLTSNDTTHYPTTSAVVTGLSGKVDTSELANASVSHANTAASVDPVKTSGVPGMMSVFEADGTSTLKTGFIGPDNSTVNYVYKLPDAVPVIGDTLVMGPPVTGQTLPDGSTGTIIPMTHAAGGSSLTSGSTTNDILKWDGDSWEPTALSAHPEFASLLAAFSAAGLNSFTFTPSVTYPIWVATSPVAVSFDVTDTSTTYAVADVDYQYDGAGGFVENMTNTIGDTWTADVTIATDGAHTIQLEAVDDKSTPNTGQSAIYTINFDATVPVIVAGADTTHDGSTAVTLTAALTELNRPATPLTYSVTNGTPATGNMTGTYPNYSASVTPTGTGNMVATYAALDLAGNAATGTDLVQNFTYDAGTTNRFEWDCSTLTAGTFDATDGGTITPFSDGTPTYTNDASGIHLSSGTSCRFNASDGNNILWSDFKITFDYRYDSGTPSNQTFVINSSYTEPDQFSIRRSTPSNTTLVIELAGNEYVQAVTPDIFNHSFHTISMDVNCANQTLVLTVDAYTYNISLTNTNVPNPADPERIYLNGLNSSFNASGVSYANVSIE